MASLDIEWIAVFNEVYQSGNVTHAAARLGMTQSAASSALAKLRLYYGDALFIRTSKGVLPTPRADELYPILQRIRNDLDVALSGGSNFDPSSSERVFKLAMTDLGEIALLPSLINLLQAQAPNLKILIEKINEETPKRLEEGSIDLAVGFMPQLEAGFYQQSLADQHFMCIVNAAHPRIRSRLSINQYLAEGHVEVQTRGTGHVQVVADTLNKTGANRMIHLRVPSFLAVAQIVAKTTLLATIPQHYAKVAASKERVKIFPTPIAFPSYTVKQHWHARYHKEPGNVWMRKVVAELMPKAIRNAI